MVRKISAKKGDVVIVNFDNYEWLGLIIDYARQPSEQSHWIPHYATGFKCLIGEEIINIMDYEISFII